MEPPYAERHIRWCDRMHGELIPMLLLDFVSTRVLEYTGAYLFEPVGIGLVEGG